MKKQNVSLFFCAMLFVALISLSCNQDKVDPALVLDEEIVPEGYVQEMNPSADAMTRLQEFRLQNPKDHYYYLKRLEPNKEPSNWVFPQKELLIEYSESTGQTENDIVGVIVKKIKGDWRNEEFKYTDTYPQPVGGMAALYAGLAQNIKYPEDARNAGIEGKVFVQFVVDKSGELRDVTAIKGIGYGCDEEAVRAVKESARWEPARIVDMSVSTRMILPISFKLDSKK